MDISDHIRALVTRIARLDAAENWEDDLNPAQIAALQYLARANRFSRAPSHVAEYLGTTRGTTSQTLKALERKGCVTETPSETDRRSISYTLTDAGRAAVARQNTLTEVVKGLSAEDQDRLRDTLTVILTASLAANGGRAFGMCETCVHHQRTGTGAFCGLLSLPLAPAETQQICHEHVAA